MNASPYFTLILQAINNALKPVGFKKKGNTLFRDREQVIQMVDLQRSTGSTAAQLIVTSNIGIYSKAIGARLSYDFGPKNVACCHLTARIGRFMDAPDDYWWRVQAEEEASQAAFQLIQLLQQRALPRLSELETTEGIYKLLRGKTAPFATAGRSNLLSCLEASLSEDVK